MVEDIHPFSPSFFPSRSNLICWLREGVERAVMFVCSCVSAFHYIGILQFMNKTLPGYLCLWVRVGVQSEKLSTFLQSDIVFNEVTFWDTHYSAESFSWYSRDLLTHSCTPESFHNLFITAANSPDRSPSSAFPANAKNCLASSWK